MKNEQTQSPSITAYALYVDTLCDGPVPVECDAEGKPVLYPTLEAAQRVIAEDVIDRFQQFLTGQRDFEDALNPEEYACPVAVLPDGSLQPLTE